MINVDDSRVNERLLYTNVKVAQLVEAWTVNHVVGRSSPTLVKLTKSLQQASNPKTRGSFRSRP